LILTAFDFGNGNAVKILIQDFIGYRDEMIISSTPLLDVYKGTCEEVISILEDEVLSIKHLQSNQFHNCRF